LKTPGIVQRHPELRWVASLVVIAAVAAVVATSVSGAFHDTSTLTTTSAQELVAKVQDPHPHGYSGTVVTRIDLGLPGELRSALATTVPVGGALLNGSHTMRYWYGGSDRQRVAVVGPTAEQDVFRNGTHVLLWDTATHSAQRSTVPEASGPLPLSLAAPAALSPPQLADRLLDLAGPDTDTTLRSGDRVADRSTYELVLTPTVTGSRIGSVHIEVDGAHSVPLAVQVYPSGSSRPALDVAFTTVSFAAPAERNFSFTPPDGATVGRASPMGSLFSGATGSGSVTGSGWLSVASYPSDRLENAVIAKLFGAELRPVRGTWGSGRLFTSPMLSLLVGDKGRVAFGAVDPALLYKALGS
jgi:outer membrane lipoprotein-sorting protein